MGFRARLALGMSVAVLLTAAVYGLLGFIAFKSTLDRDREESVASFRQAAISSVDVSGDRPIFQLDEMNQAVFEEYSSSRFRVLQAEQVVLEFRGAFPLDTIGWFIERVPLDNNYTLETAFNTLESTEALNAYWRTTLLALPIALGVALLLSFFLQRFLLKPMRDLRNATAVLSRQAIPEPIDVPAGNDELSQLAESFNRMTSSMQAFIDRERSFTRYASHELRTPLSNFRVLIEGAQKDLFTPQEAWPKLEETLKRMEGMLNGLLTLTRSPQLNPEPVLLEPLIQEVFAALAKPTKTRVVYESQDNSLLVLGQDDLIKNIISNLLSNALKYTEGHVYLNISENKDHVYISVRDQGLGVPPEVLEKITEPFFRVDSRKGGLGLGLALVKHIALAMQGELILKNLSPGFEATVRLPSIALDNVSAKDKESIYA